LLIADCRCQMESGRTNSNPQLRRGLLFSFFLISLRFLILIALKEKKIQIVTILIASFFFYLKKKNQRYGFLKIIELL
jgi:hypothetical protein